MTNSSATAEQCIFPQPGRMAKWVWRTGRPATAVLLSLLLVACGGNPDAEPAPVAAPAPSVPTSLAVAYGVKAYNLSWDSSPDATHYEVVEDPDGADPEPASITSVAAVAGATQTSTVALPSLLQRLNAQYRVRACNAGGCSPDSASLTPNLTEAIGYFKASNTGASDQFGYAVALSADGNTLAVGTNGEDSNATGVDGNQAGNQADNSAFDSGAVYVFSRSGTTWSQQAYVKASNAGGGDQFGRAVALSADGNTLAVGANREDSSATGVNIGNQADNSAASAGAAYVFSRSGTTWSQQAYVKASNTEGIDEFGYAVALSSDGNTLAVGAYEEGSNATGVNGDETNNSSGRSGAVYVFSRSGINWSQQAYVKASNTGASDQFGYAVALSADGNTLAVGAYGEDSNATGVNDINEGNNDAGNAGAVYVFSRSGINWSQQAYVKASNTGDYDEFGYAVAISADGNTLAVGAFREDSSATGVNGDAADNSAVESGAVYVFSRSGATWSQQAYVKASNTGGFDWFGYAVALSADGNTLAVGAAFEDSSATGVNGNEADNSAFGAGAAYVFSRSGINWSQQAYVKASNTGVNDAFGYAVALSADGNTLAVGAYGEGSIATGVNGDAANNSAGASGAVYLY